MSARQKTAVREQRETDPTGTEQAQGRPGPAPLAIAITQNSVSRSGAEGSRRIPESQIELPGSQGELVSIP